MVKRKKRQLNHICGAKADFYKKGKKHRVLVCENCGIIATNPLPLLGAVASAVAPKVLKKGKEILTGKKDKEESNVIKHVYDSLDKPNKGERYLHMVI